MEERGREEDVEGREGRGETEKLFESVLTLSYVSLWNRR